MSKGKADNKKRKQISATKPYLYTARDEHRKEAESTREIYCSLVLLRYFTPELSCGKRLTNFPPRVTLSPSISYGTAGSF